MATELSTSTPVGSPPAPRTGGDAGSPLYARSGEGDHPEVLTQPQLGLATQHAVALGWQLAEFNEFVVNARPSPSVLEDRETRPRTASTMWDRAARSDGERADLDLRLIRRSMTELVGLVQVPGVEGLLSTDGGVQIGREPTVDVHLETLEKCVEEEVWRKDGLRADFLSKELLERLDREVPKIHTVAMQCLFTADVRLGKAYLAGGQLRSLCGDLSVWTDLYAASESDGVGVAHVAKTDSTWFDVERRLATIQDQIVALKGALPDSAAHPVSRSIQTWRLWLLAQPDDTGPIWPSEDNKAIARLFRAQAHRWRTLLTGEATGTELLTIESVAEIGSEVLKRVRGSLWKLLLVISPIVFPIVLAGAGVVALAWHFASGAAVSTTALGTLLTVLGAIWKAASPVRQRLMSSVDLHQEQLFRADVDHAVANAITLLPPRSAKKPRPGFGRARARRDLVQIAHAHGWEPA